MERRRGGHGDPSSSSQVQSNLVCPFSDSPSPVYTFSKYSPNFVHFSVLGGMGQSNLHQILLELHSSWGFSASTLAFPWFIINGVSRRSMLCKHTTFVTLEIPQLCHITLGMKCKPLNKAFGVLVSLILDLFDPLFDSCVDPCVSDH